MQKNQALLKELQRRAAGLLSTGTMSQREVAVSLNLKPTTISYWMKDEEFRQMIVELARDRTNSLLEEIEESAMTAIARLRAHITATTKAGQPLWQVQMDAIKLALAYQLGQPTAKSEAKELKLSGDLNESVRQALADPTIRGKLLRAPVPLPSEEVIDVSYVES